MEQILENSPAVIEMEQNVRIVIKAGKVEDEWVFVSKSYNLSYSAS